MNKPQVQDLIQAGVHFGHLTRKWNPNMSPYIYMEKNGIHIINLYKTQAKLEEACNALKKLLLPEEKYSSLRQKNKLKILFQLHPKGLICPT
jgi:small subunit ribosomal protein S2